MKKRVYSKEFKEQAVRLSPQRENIKELAYELGINVQRLYKWRRWANSTLTTTVKATVPEESSEVKKLRKTLREKELELEILKRPFTSFPRAMGDLPIYSGVPPFIFHRKDVQGFKSKSQ